MHSDTGGYRDHHASLRRYRRTGVLLIAAFGGTFGVWASTVPLSGAVIATGHLEVDGNVKKVQHRTGGIVSEILVEDGQRVAEGQAVIRLDPTQARSDLEMVEHQLADFEVTRARLNAERDGLDHFEIPDHILNDQGSAFEDALYQRERRAFKARREARLGQEGELAERINQLNQQIKGLEEQADAKINEKNITTRELTSLHQLLGQKLVLVSQVNLLERNATQIEGEIGEIEASIAEVRGKIVETKLQILNIDQVAAADASKELADVESKISELVGKRVQAQDTLARIDIRAPRNGFVQELSTHTIGGVISPGEVLMTIVPEHAPLNVETRISPQEIDAIHVGDNGYIRISGLNRATTPDIKAKVEMVGADLVQDQTTHVSYYPVRLHPSPGEMERLGDIQLVPGMPVEAFITTSRRTFVAYLWTPIRDRMSRAIREK
ncbi:HlyD family type I secretion periplasmic adaptor subunit [Rhizobium ruizarguesonis]